MHRRPICSDRRRRLALSIVLAAIAPGLASAQTIAGGPWEAIDARIGRVVQVQGHRPYPYPILPLPQRRPEAPEVIPEWIGPGSNLPVEQEQVASIEEQRPATVPSAPATSLMAERFELIGPSSLSASPGSASDDRPLTEPPALSRGLNIGPTALEADTETSEMRDLQVAAEDIALLPRPGESIVQLPNSQGYRILFGAGSESLTNAGGSLLEGLAQRMTTDPSLWIQIRAFATDPSGGPSNSRSLSLNRALLIRSFLIDRGVRSTRVDIRALGNTAENEPRDRVDLIFSN